MSCAYSESKQDGCESLSCCLHRSNIFHDIGVPSGHNNCCIILIILSSASSPDPIASDFFQTFRDFGIRRKLIFFSLTLVNFTAEKCTVWRILKVPGPIASDFSPTFGDFGIRRKLIFFSLLLVNFTAEKCTVWKILMKM